MKHKKIISAVMALSMLGMAAQAISANAEEVSEDVPATVDEGIEAADADVSAETTTMTEIQPDTTPAETTETYEEESTASTTETDADDSTTTVTTTATKTAYTTTETETTVTVTDDLAAPKIGDFKVTAAEDGDGEIAVISWEAVEGADGYQIYKTSVEASSKDTPTSYAFDVKGTSYQTGASVPLKETIKVRAYSIQEDGTRVYGAWSVSKTVYLNGMEPDPETTKASTTTTTSSTETTTTSSEDSESPKTGDANIPAIWISTSAAAMMAAVFAKKKRK